MKQFRTHSGHFKTTFWQKISTSKPLLSTIKVLGISIHTLRLQYWHVWESKQVYSQSQIVYSRKLCNLLDYFVSSWDNLTGQSKFEKCWYDSDWNLQINVKTHIKFFSETFATPLLYTVYTPGFFLDKNMKWSLQLGCKNSSPNISVQNCI